MKMSLLIPLAAVNLAFAFTPHVGDTWHHRSILLKNAMRDEWYNTVLEILPDTIGNRVVVRTVDTTFYEYNDSISIADFIDTLSFDSSVLFQPQPDMYKCTTTVSINGQLSNAVVAKRFMGHYTSVNLYSDTMGLLLLSTYPIQTIRLIEYNGVQVQFSDSTSCGKILSVHRQMNIVQPKLFSKSRRSARFDIRGRVIRSSGLGATARSAYVHFYEVDDGSLRSELRVLHE